MVTVVSRMGRSVSRLVPTAETTTRVANQYAATGTPGGVSGLVATNKEVTLNALLNNATNSKLPPVLLYSHVVKTCAGIAPKSVTRNTTGTEP